jgi:hypothetical protein
MDDTTKVATLERVGKMTRARVKDSLKSTVERELVDVEPITMGHSKFVHVVALELDADTMQKKDEALASSIWGSDNEDQVRRFAERLASVKPS